MLKAVYLSNPIVLAEIHPSMISLRLPAYKQGLSAFVVNIAKNIILRLYIIYLLFNLKIIA